MKEEKDFSENYDVLSIREWNSKAKLFWKCFYEGKNGVAAFSC